MTPILILLGLLLGAGVIIYWFGGGRDQAPAKEAAGDPQPAAGSDAACTQSTPVCEATGCDLLGSSCASDRLLAASQKPVEYYDDQELDAFAGMGEDDYTPEQVDQFRDVLYTLQPADLAGWHASVCRRGITLPRAIADEFIMLINEARTAATQ